MSDIDRLEARLSLRLPDSLFGLLHKISLSTGLSVSELVRRAIIKWICSAPDEFPLELKAPIARLDIQNTISLVKDIRYIYHKAREAEKALNELKIEAKRDRFPPHVVRVLESLERVIAEKCERFDLWLRKEGLSSLE